MTTRSKSRALCVAASMALLTIAPASAFAMPATATAVQQAQAEQGAGRSQRRSRGRTPAAPTPEQNQAAAQAFLTSQNINCQATKANFLGETAEGGKLYEAVCANDFGYLLLASETAPMALSCIEITASQARALAADPNASVGPKCELPENDNYLAVLTRYAADARVECNVDQGNILGKRDGQNVYEIGCAGTDGYRINIENGAWSATSCMELVSANSTCEFTTKAEQIATVKAWAASSPEASACNFSDVRYMGANANGSFYEAACAGADGQIIRFDNAKAVQQVYACEVASQIGGGCKLTAGAPQGDNAPTS